MNFSAIHIPDAAAFIHMLGWTLLHFLWQGCAIATAFALAMLAMRRAAPPQRYLAGCITLAMMATAPVATFTWLWQRADGGSPIDAVATRPAGSLAAAPVAEIDPTLLWIVIAWLIGACACGLWVTGGWWQTRRLRSLEAAAPSQHLTAVVRSLAQRVGSGAAVRIVNSAAVVAPMTIGVLKPIVLIPAAMLANLSPAHLEAIIAHELAHVRRLDFLINLLQALLEALLFYHPAVWWVSHVVRQEREYCCDDVAAGVCGNKVTYARALAELEALRGASLRLGLSSQGGSLMKRIARLVGEGGSGAVGTVRSRLAAPVATLALIGVTTAAFALAEAPKERTKPATQGPSQIAQQAESQVRGDICTLAFQGLVANSVEIAGDSGEMPEGEYQFVLALDAGEDGVIVEGCPLSIEQQVAGETGIARLRWMRAAEAMVNARELAAAEPPIDPANMPTDGLIRAAQYAYPFNLFDLTPWVDPRAHDLLVEPTPTVPVQLLLTARALAQYGEIKIDLIPQIVELRGNVMLKTMHEGDVTTVTADHLTVDFTPAPVPVEGEWLLDPTAADESAAPAPHILHWLHSVRSRAVEPAPVASETPIDAPPQQPAPTVKPSDAPPSPAPMPEPPPKP